MKKYSFSITVVILFACSLSHARDRIKLETTVIKGNKEMPQIVYIVPWKDIKGDTQQQQKLVLHSLFGNLFEPVHVADTRSGNAGISNHPKTSNNKYSLAH